MNISHEKIQKALFATGEVYEKKMNDYPEAAKAYEELLRRYPKNKMELEAYFNLYLIHYKQTKNAAEAEKYRNKILREYPDSKYAKILSDPDYLKKLQETKSTIAQLYEDAFNAYKINDFATVSTKTEAAFSISPDNELKPKFLFLKAQIAGQTGDQNQMKNLLKEIIAKYPKDDVTPRAKDVLAVLESGKYDPNLYKFDENARMYYEIVLQNSPENINKLKFKLSNFNVEKFPNLDLKIETAPLSDSKVQLFIKTFNGKIEAKNYINLLNSNFILSDFNPEQYEHFIISEENFNSLQKLPDLSRYLDFYKKMY
jgi:tetratricopeptide (TPR) repeat protein